MFYDTHAHLDYPDFQPDMRQVVERATSAGITRIISVGTDLESSRRAVALAEQFECIYAAVGWHPNDAHNAPPDLPDQLRVLATHPKVVAIGEIGLDYYRLPSKERKGTPEEDEQSKRRQAEVFEQQLAVAADLGLNCIVHQRDSMEATMTQLQPWLSKLRAVFHCYAGDVPTLHRILETGCIVSYTGILTFKNAHNVRESLAAAPLGKFMLETDCPFLTPEPHRKVRRCEPMHARTVAEKAAEVKGITLEQLSEGTCAAARDFFRKLR